MKKYRVLDYIIISLVAVGIIIVGLILRILIWITYFKEKYEKRKKQNIPQTSYKT
jgi:plastocyanin domain-containing protein